MKRTVEQGRPWRFLGGRAPSRSALTPLVLLLATAGQGAAQDVSQAELARQIISDHDVRYGALDRARAIPAGQRSAPLRSALVQALDQMNSDVNEPSRHSGMFERPEPSFRLGLASAVAQMNDPASIPVLISALDTGYRVMKSLGGFGERAADPLLRRLESGSIEDPYLGDAFVVLRFLVERSSHAALSPETVSEIREIRMTQLNKRHRFGTNLRRAIDLGYAIHQVYGDEEILRIVQDLAHDRASVVARGVTSPDLIEKTMPLVQERLAGVPALPKWDL